MKTPRKIWKSIAKKIKNRNAAKETIIQDPEVSSSTGENPLEETREDVFNEIEQQVVAQDTVETTDGTCTEVCNFNVEHKPIIDKATTDNRLCEDVNKSSEDLQPICESSEQTSMGVGEKELNIPSPTELRSGSGNVVDTKPSTRQRQAILVGIVGAVSLVSGVALYIMKMPIVAAVVGIAGLICVSFALYNVLKPSTKLEKVKSVEQPTTDLDIEANIFTTQINI